MRILVLEPYHGASHKRFLDDLEAHLPFEFWRLTQPARAWKWRMRFSAPSFVQVLEKLEGEEFDLILASTFLSLADFRGLAPERFAQLPAIVYWHENQWAYPSRNEDVRDRHFVITNFTTALAADLNLFNSEWNRSSFLEGMGLVLKDVPDTHLQSSLAKVAAKSLVLPPALTQPLGKKEEKSATLGNQPPVILWNHRWEHDKNPEEFFAALLHLKEQKIPFELMVLGQSFKTQPDVFGEAKSKLSKHITHWGHVKDRKAYEALLYRADFVVSTAVHEFFGLSVMEAALAGAEPIVPDHLSYPEIYPEAFRYPPGELATHLPGRIAGRVNPSSNLPPILASHLWTTQKPQWEKTFRQVARMKPKP